MNDSELAECAERAFDIVQRESMSTMGKASAVERAAICNALVPELKKGAALPEVASLPTDRRRNVVTKAGAILLRRLVARTP